MGCKHKEIIAIKENGDKEFYCKIFDRKISDYDCKNCLMKIEDNNVEQLFEQLFRGGFKGNLQ